MHIKNNLFKIIISLIIILAGTFLFYWLNLRAANIRKQCNTEAKGKIKNSGSIELKGDTGLIFFEAKESNYKDCLRSKGLEK